MKVEVVLAVTEVEPAPAVVSGARSVRFPEPSSRVRVSKGSVTCQERAAEAPGAMLSVSEVKLLMSSTPEGPKL